MQTRSQLLFVCLQVRVSTHKIVTGYNSGPNSYTNAGFSLRIVVAGETYKVAG